LENLPRSCDALRPYLVFHTGISKPPKSSAEPPDQLCRLQVGLSAGVRLARHRARYLKVIRSVRLRVEALFFKGSFSAFELC
jgi:hypothetical protein